MTHVIQEPPEHRGSGSVASWANAVLALLYPEICQLCGAGRAGPAQGFVCEKCQNTVRWIVPPFCSRCGLAFQGDISVPFECSNCRDRDFAFVRARSAALARDVVLEAIHRYKYQRALFLEPFLAGLLLAKAVPELRSEPWDVIAPVPLHPAKEREREFNQAGRLAKRLSAATGIPLETGLLRRVLPTQTQTRLTREERLKNVSGAFALRRGATAAGKRVVVVDDVFTTGATTNACAERLVHAGAAAVCVWTVARGI
jgi:competence protein ComFC